MGAMLEARFLGQFLLRANNTVIDIPSRPAQSLLAYLMLNAGVSLRREHLSALLWPDAARENARSNLRHALWRIRKGLDACQLSSRKYIQADDFTICFEANAEYWLDTAVLEEQVDKSEPECLLQSISVYEGELLPGFYDPWVLLERERLQAVFTRKMNRLLQYLLAEQNWPAVMQQSERWIALGLSPEPAYCALMVAHTAVGDTSSMATVYQRCCHDLQYNLGVQPAAATKALFDRLVQGKLPDFAEPGQGEKVDGGSKRPELEITQLAEGQQLKMAQAEAAQLKKETQRLLHEKRRLSRWAVAIMLLLMLALITVIAAIQQAALSRRQLRASEARELAAVAVNQLAHDPERGLLLALTAVERLRAAGEPLPAEVVSSFRQTLQALRVVLTVPGTGGVAFSPDGRYLATTDIDHQAKIWNAQTGDEVMVLAGHHAELMNLVFSPDGTRLLSTSLDGQAIIWDVYSGQALLSLSGHEAGVIDAAFTAGGTRVLTTSYDGTVRIWDARSGKEMLTIGEVGIVSGAAFTPQGNRALIADHDAFIARLWDIANGQELLQLIGHTAGVNDVAISGDGRQLLTSSDDSTVKLWDAASGQLLTTLHHDSAVLGVDFSPNGAQLASVSQKGTIYIWDIETGHVILTLPSQPAQTTQVVFDPSGSRLASGGAPTRVWDISPAGSRELLTIAAHEGLVSGVAYDAGGGRLASAGWDGAVKVWDASTGALIQQFDGQDERAAFIAFSAVNEQLAAAGYDGMVRIWDLETASEQARLSPSSLPASQVRSGSPWILGVAFSPDGRYMATTSQDGTVTMWDAASMQALRTLSGHKGIVFRASFSPDSRLIVTAGDDKIARIWESGSGAELLRLAEHEDSVTAAVFSPDGRQLATSSFDKTVRLWDLSSGAELKRLQGHSAAVWDVDFSPDGRYLYSIGFDGTVRQWDVETGQELFILFDGDVGPDLALSPDGRRLATTSTSGLVRVHVLSLVELVEQARSRLTRSLTPAECQRFLHQLPCPSLLSQ